jgi:hypothetical protein
VAAVRSIIIDQPTVRRDFDADQMEYHNIDFTDNAFFNVYIVDNYSKRLNVTATFIFDIVKICM